MHSRQINHQCIGTREHQSRFAARQQVHYRHPQKHPLHTKDGTNTNLSASNYSCGFSVQFKNNACKILSPALKWKIIASIAQVNGLYAIPAQAEESAHMAKLTINELHHALGHVAQGAV
jgi:hypothetical protein